jgi:hypothetical protein
MSNFYHCELHGEQVCHKVTLMSGYGVRSDIRTQLSGNADWT